MRNTTIEQGDGGSQSRMPGYFWWLFWLLFVALLIRLDIAVDGDSPGAAGWAATVGTLVGIVALGLMSLPMRRPLTERDRAFLFKMAKQPATELDARMALIDEARRLALLSREALGNGMYDRPWALDSLRDEYDEQDEPAEDVTLDHPAFDVRASACSTSCQPRGRDEPSTKT
jgi:hypothetical protein